MSGNPSDVFVEPDIDSYGELKKRTIYGGLIFGVSQGVRFLFYIATTIVLARLLLPEDFGLVAMVAALVSFLRFFKEAGLSTATVQRRDISNAQVSNLFWINLVLGGIAATVCVALSPLLAWFFGDTRLISIGSALSLIFLFSGATVQPFALLNRQLRFMAIATIEISGTVMGFVVGVSMAKMGFGYWSLVGMQIAIPIVECVLVFIVLRWCPQRYRKRSETRLLVAFGARLTGATLLTKLAAIFDSLLVGKVYGAVGIGYYSRASALLTQPLNQLITPFNNVLVPALSRLQDDDEQYRMMFNRVYGAIAMISFAIAGLLLGLSEPLVLIALGSKWEPVVPIFAAFSLSALFIPTSFAVAWLMTTQGRGRDMLRVGWAWSVSSVIAVICGISFGIVGVAIAVSVFGLFVRTPLQYYFAGREGPVSTRDLWGMFFSFMPIWLAVVCGALIGNTIHPTAEPLSRLLITTPIALGFGAVTVCCLKALRAPAFELVGLSWGIVQRFWKKR